MKVGMDDPSSVEFVERRRAGLERRVSLCAPEPSRGTRKPEPSQGGALPHLERFALPPCLAGIFRESCPTRRYYKTQMSESSWREKTWVLRRDSFFNRQMAVGDN